MTETTDDPTSQDGNEQPTTHDSATAPEPVTTESQEVVTGGSTDDATGPQTTSEESTPETEQDVATGGDESQSTEELPADADELDTGVYVAQI